MGQEGACPIAAMASTSDATGNGSGGFLRNELLDRARGCVASSSET